MITHDEIRNIAALAKLNVSEDELDSLTNEMNSIIAFADEIQQAEAVNGDFDIPPVSLTNLRKDEVHTSLDPDSVLANAGEREEDFFVVKYKIGEKR